MSMLAGAEDLLIRAFEAIVPRLDPARDVLVLQDLMPSADAEGLPVTVPFGTGILPWTVCRRFVAAIPDGLRIALGPQVEPEALEQVWG